VRGVAGAIAISIEIARTIAAATLLLLLSRFAKLGRQMYHKRGLN
jgi:hypothetical protein